MAKQIIAWSAAGISGAIASLFLSQLIGQFKAQEFIAKNLDDWLSRGLAPQIQKTTESTSAIAGLTGVFLGFGAAGAAAYGSKERPKKVEKVEISTTEYEALQEAAKVGYAAASGNTEAFERDLSNLMDKVGG